MNLKIAILKTLIYADIFSFPLTKTELWKFLIAPLLSLRSRCYIGSGNLQREFNKILKLLLKNKTIGKKDNFFYLKGKEGLVKQRKSLIRINQEKTEIAKKFVKKIKFIPWIKAVLITGALAVGNAQKNDDIDLFIITSKKRLWLTRFLCILIAEIFGVRRKPNQKKVKNKICFNLFLTEDSLSISSSKRNLFTAHEIIQARPIFSKEKTYKKFLRENLWVRQYLPNVLSNQQCNSKFKTKDPYLLSTIYYLLDLLEILAYQLQLKYMNSKKTIEQVSSNFAFFHPQNKKKSILAKYTRKINETRKIQS